MRRSLAGTLFVTLITYKTAIADWRLVVRGHVGQKMHVGQKRQWGGWTRPTPPNLSSCSLFQWRRERERESLVNTFFFRKYPPL